ncbi:MAG: DUF192 domain-containing protein [bacterium]|nr:DUF192 domain-containing protein [bacterium]
MKRKLLIGGGVILLIGALWMLVATRAPGEPQGPLLSIGGNTISLEIADTDEERELGLGNREAIPPDSGMLFVFTESDAYGVWMKEMHFPLDVVWLASAKADTGNSQDDAKKEHDLVVVDIKENIAPETYPEEFYPSESVLYVLEIPAGTAKKNGIQIGSVLTFKE